MKYIAFGNSVAQLAASFIANHCIAKQVKVDVELITPNAVQLTSEITDVEMSVIGPIIEKFGGQWSDELPQPVDFLNKMPAPARRTFEEYDFEYAANYRKQIAAYRDPVPDPGSRRKDSGAQYAA